MAPRRKKPVASKRIDRLAPLRAELKCSVAYPILTALLPPAPTHRDRVHYYKTGRDGGRVVMDVETGDVVQG